jgi:hypothetical protein
MCIHVICYILILYIHYDYNIIYQYNNTALICGAISGNTDIVVLLLDRGAYIKAKDMVVWCMYVYV